MKRRVLSILLVFMLMFTSMPITSSANNNNNYKVDWLVQNGIVQGRNGGDLALAKNITRAEFTRMVLASTGELQVADTYVAPSVFNDVPNSHWAQRVIAYATQKGYLAGYTNGSFRPDAFIKLDECIAILARLNPGFVEPAVNPAYWAQAYIDYARANGILDGIPDMSDYKVFATRQIAFDVVYNEIQVYAFAKLKAEEDARKLLEAENARKEAEAEEDKRKDDRRSRDDDPRDRIGDRGRYYRETEYAIFFERNGGSGYMRTDYFVGEGYYRLPACNFEAPLGYHFGGWTVNGYIYKVGQVVYVDRDLYVSPIWLKNDTEPVPPTPTPTPDPTPTPTPEPGNFNVTFNYNGHGENKTIVVKDGDKVKEPSAPQAEGYEFKGWFTDKAYITPYKFDSAVKAELTLYAKWDAIKYKVTVEKASYGSITAEPTEDLIIGTEVKLTVKADEGYQLDELTVKTEDDKTVAVNSDNIFTMPAANVIVTATFKVREYNITVIGLDGASLTVPKSATKDTEITVDPTAKPGYSIVEVTVKDASGKAIELSPEKTFNMPAEDVTITITFEKIKYNVLVADDIAKGSVKVEPKEATVGDTIKVTATPEPGYQIDTITYTVDGSTEKVEVKGDKFTMPAADVTVTATFKEKEYEIKVEVNPAEGGSIEVAKSAKTGANVELTVNAKPGYKLDTLTYTEDGKAEAKEITGNKFKMPAKNVTIKATFKKIVYTITVEKSEHGSVKANKEKASIGDTITVTATPAEGYQLDTITYTPKDGKPVTINGKTFKMPAANVTVTATFKLKEYTIKVVKPAEGGSIEVATPSASIGTKITVEVNPAEGYELDTLTYTVDGQAATKIIDNEFLMPAKNVTIKATFKKIVYKIEVEPSEHGSVKANTENASIGDTITITDTPEPGYQIDKITYTVNDGTKQFDVKDKKFKMPAGNVKIKATFTDKKYKLTVITKLTDGQELGTKDYEYKYKEEIQITVPYYEEYKFGRFETKADNGEIVNISNKDKTFTMPASNLTVTIVLTKKTLHDRLVDIMVNGAKNFDPTTKTITLDRPMTYDEYNRILDLNSVFDDYIKAIKGTYTESIILSSWCWTKPILSYDASKRDYIVTQLEFTPLIRYHHYIIKEANSLWFNNNRTEEQNEQLKSYIIQEMNASKQREETYIEPYINKFANTLNGKSDYEKVKAVHNYIITNASYMFLKYSKDGYNVGSIYHGGDFIYTINDISVHSSLAIATQKLGVCQSYAGLFQRFMEKFGIESYYVSGNTKVPGDTGEASGASHAWNKIKLDGNYYNIDLTWDDLLDGTGKIQPLKSGLENYRYFLRSDGYFEKSRDMREFSNLRANSDHLNRPKGTLDEPGRDLDTELGYFNRVRGNQPMMMYEILQKRPAEIERVYRNIRNNETQNIKDTKKEKPAA